MFRTIGNMNITREIPVDISAGDYEDRNGFYIRSAIGGSISYLPFDATTDAEAITKTVDASPYFIDPVLCRKIFQQALTSPPTDLELYVGYGV